MPDGILSNSGKPSANPINIDEQPDWLAQWRRQLTQRKDRPDVKAAGEFDEDLHPRDESGKFTDGSGGGSATPEGSQGEGGKFAEGGGRAPAAEARVTTQARRVLNFFSPSVAVGLTVAQARKQMESQEMRDFEKVVTDLYDEIGATNATYSTALGVWKDGGEHSMVVEATMDPRSARYGACVVGKALRQKAVLHFVQDDGPDSVYSFEAPASLEQGRLQATLSSHGFGDLTVVPHGATQRVYLYDKGSEKRASFSAALKELGAHGREVKGTGEFIGADWELTKDMSDEESRDASGKVFDDEIARNRRFVRRIHAAAGAYRDGARWWARDPDPRRCSTSIAAAGEFDEDLHPRDESGKFTDGGGGGRPAADPRSGDGKLGDEKRPTPAVATKPAPAPSKPPEARALDDIEKQQAERSQASRARAAVEMDPDISALVNSVSAVADDAVTDHPRAYRPSPIADNNGDGVTDASRVGVPGLAMPPPPSEVPRLPNLTATEREVEARFAAKFEADPDGMTRDYMKQVMNHKDPNMRSTFGTDDVKVLGDDYGASIENKSLYNVAVHQAANAVAKRAFVAYLDEVVAKLPEERRSILVTAGGCAAGKGYALKNAAKEISAAAGAVWDTAGEQNSTELPWVQAEAEKRGIKVTYAYIDADPLASFPRVIKRALDPKDGRMVDAMLFTESYTIGAKNFESFYRANAGKADFVFLSARGATPTRLMDFPAVAVEAHAKDIYKAVMAQVGAASREGKLPPHLLRGATIGSRIWK